ncbi:hypothetical protein D9M68_379180 [compost metagenome]
MNKRLIAFFFFCLLFLGAMQGLKAQDLKVNGVVFDKETKLRIALAEVRNKRSGYSVGSNDMGIFTIGARIGDTLLIIKRGYNDQELAIKSAADLVLYLNRGITLNTVEIIGQSKKQALDEIRREFKNKGSFHAGKPSFLSFIFTPLTAIYELVGRTPKNARRFNRYYVTEMQQSQIDLFFNKSIISSQTGLSGRDLDNFMMNYRPPYDQAKNWNTYDGLKWIKDSYKKYSDTAGKKPEVGPGIK